MSKPTQSFTSNYLMMLDRFRTRELIQKICYLPGRGLQLFFRYIGHQPLWLIQDYQQELLQNKELRNTYLAAINNGWIPNKYGSWEGRFGNLFRCGANISWFYALIRELKPNRIIETGTNAGSMTSVMLAAIEKNEKGELISIDLPAEEGKNNVDLPLPEGQKPGYLIPEAYRQRWQLRIGDAKDLLVTALREKPCDIFIHDSLHTYEHMIWEYISAYLNMGNNKIIISDDILWNKAWWDFTRNFNLPRFQELSNPNVGVTVIIRRI